MPMHYVYAHHRTGPDHGVFYVGKGVGSRKSSRSGRTMHWRNVVAKHSGFRVSVIDEFEAPSDAFAAEIEVIALLREMGARIVNITDGGEGCSGRDKGKTLTPEHRRKLVEAKLGTRQSAETIEKRASQLRGRAMTPQLRAMYSDTRRRMFGRGVTCVETGDVFKCMDDAAEWLCGSERRRVGRSAICNCCKGVRKTAYGYTWKYTPSGI